MATLLISTFSKKAYSLTNDMFYQLAKANGPLVRIVSKETKTTLFNKWSYLTCAFLFDI